MTKMRFAFISTMSGAPWGGSEELWSQAALRLRQEGHKISASVAWWPQLSSKVLELERQGTNLFIRKYACPNLALRLLRKIKRSLMASEKNEFQWLRRLKPDLVVISQGGTADGLEWMNFCAATGQPFVSIVQCNTEAWYLEDSQGLKMAKAYRSAKDVLCVSRHNLELLERQIGEKLPNAKVVWNPYSVAPEYPPVWPKNNGVWKMACVARLEPSAKGQDLLFQVLAQKKWRECPIEVNLYGSGPCEQTLKNLARSLDLKNIRFCGHVTNIKAIWEENHLLVMPSRWEGLPISLVEAMWCARPCIVTDVGGNAELCLDGKTGFVVAAPTVKLLDQTLELAWNRRGEWEDMGKSARKRAEDMIPKDPVGDFCRVLNPL